TGMASSKQETGGPDEAGNSSPAWAIKRAEPYRPSVLPGNDIDGQMMYGYDYAVQQALRIR
ncbi:MAG TPA: hypothetical protein VFR58_03195, partial [Flavisolibacter sp.]|nr:hypothetical protein [Flavisolibacter sp.]